MGACSLKRDGACSLRRYDGACSLKRYDGCMPRRVHTRVRVIAIARLCTDEEEILEDEVRNTVPKVVWSSLKSYNKVK